MARLLLADNVELICALADCGERITNKGMDAFVRGYAFAAGALTVERYMAMDAASEQVEAEDDPTWITVHPNGRGYNSKGGKISGRHVLIEEETGEVLAGAGGKFNGKHISAMPQRGANEQHGAQAVIQHHKELKAHPLAAEAEQATREENEAKAEANNQATTPEPAAATNVQKEVKAEAQKQAEETKAQAAQKQKEIESKAKEDQNQAQEQAEGRENQSSLPFASEGSIAEGFNHAEFNLDSNVPKLKNKAAIKALKEENAALLGLVKPGEYKWESPNMPDFDSETAKANFANLQQQAYAFKAMQRFALANGGLPKETSDKGQKLLSQYHEEVAKITDDKALSLMKECNALQEKVQSFPEDYLYNYKFRFDGVIYSLLQDANTHGNVNISALPNAIRSYLQAAQLLQGIECPDWLRAKQGVPQDLYDACYTQAKTLFDQAEANLRLLMPDGWDDKALAERITTMSVQRALGPTSYAPKSVAGVKKGNEMSHDIADNSAPNPHFLSHVQAKRSNGRIFEPYQENCQTCVIAYELRRRGFDVSALPNFWITGSPADKIAHNGHLYWKNTDTNAAPDLIKAKNIASIGDSMLEGARYHVRWTWKGSKNGHIVTAFKHGGKAYIYDPQSGETFSAEQYHSNLGSGIKSVSFYRVDDCEFFTKSADAILDKADSPIKTSP